jgi:hypothetical protein
MSEIVEKQPLLSLDQQLAKKSGDTVSPIPPSRASEYARYALAFLCGCLASIAVHYMLRGTSIQVTPEAFVSLVFTIAVGAASLVLAIIAISYGRISERVMTERADRSIDIQMNLFQKSLDLQTQLFDKTMSTLESIGRSTGVTEQRLGDIHAYMQSPAFLKQIAGRAVEQTASELSASGKASPQESELESHLAERLTKNIVNELSSRWESLIRPAPSISSAPVSAPVSTTAAAVAAAASKAPPQKPFEEQARDYQRQTEIKRTRNRMQSLLETIVASIPDAKITRSQSNALWEDLITYKGKTVAIDMRVVPPMDTDESRVAAYDGSMRRLFEHEEIDCLVFLFGKPPNEKMTQYLEARSRMLHDRMKFLVLADEEVLRNDLVALLESVAAGLPSE